MKSSYKTQQIREFIPEGKKNLRIQNELKFSTYRNVSFHKTSIAGNETKKKEPFRHLGSEIILK